MSNFINNPFDEGYVQQRSDADRVIPFDPPSIHVNGGTAMTSIDLQRFFHAGDGQQRFQVANDIELAVRAACIERGCPREALAEFNESWFDRVGQPHFDAWNSKESPPDCRFDTDFDCPHHVIDACLTPNRPLACKRCRLNCPCKRCSTGLDKLVQFIDDSSDMPVKKRKGCSTITVAQSVLRECLEHELKVFADEIAKQSARSLFNSGRQAGVILGYLMACDDIYNGGRANEK